jgi:hypothetical protein
MKITSIEYNSPYTQGLGVSYREEFDSLKELLIRWRLAKEERRAARTTTAGRFSSDSGIALTLQPGKRYCPAVNNFFS